MLELLTEHAGIIHKLCFMYTNNNDEYKDLKQEISYQLLKSYGKYKGDSKVSTWIYKVSLFTALSFIRRKPKSYSQLEDVANTSFISEEFDEWNNVLLRIKMLPEMDKTLVFLYLEDKSYKEISEIMGLSESNVGVKLNRIKKKLKEYFTE
ncbi:MAG: RNA polymerase subunit sigma-70 [Bacteroidetes bacterium]|nr:MAG: RNA polymerase subunit sigma-70 [Bacteroidota bacterium]